MQDPAIAMSPPALDYAQTGGFGIRFASRLIDWVITLVLGLIGGIIGGIGLGIAAAMHLIGGDWLHKLQSASTFSGIGWGLVAAVVYHSVSEGVAGTSFGKLALGYRVVHTDGRPCSFFGAFKRSLAFFIDSLFFGIPAYSAMQKSAWQQRLGDQWADTVVIKAAGLPPGSLRSGGLLAMGLIGGALGHGLIIMISTIAKAL